MQGVLAHLRHQQLHADAHTATLTCEVKGTIAPLTVTRSDGYDGKLTWQSSDESVLKVDAETGAITIVGVGTATITVSGAETAYRKAPTVVSNLVQIYMRGDANGDGKVDAADIVEAISAMQGEASAKFVLKNADMDNDHKMTTADIEAIASLIFKISLCN